MFIKQPWIKLDQGNDFEPSCELMNIHKTINFRKGNQVPGI